MIVEDCIEDNQTKININNEKYPYNQYEAIKKEKQSQHRTLLSNIKNPSGCSESNRREEEDQEEELIDITVGESRISLESAVEEEEIEHSDKLDITSHKIDWGSSKIWERKLIRAWGERTQQLRLIENGKRELEEEREQIESMRETVMLEMNNLKVEKDKLAEVEPQIPLARQLQMMKVDVGNFIPWNEMVRKYAMSHNVDLTAAAFNVKNILEAFKELEFIRKEIEKSEGYFSALCEATRDCQRAIADLLTRILEVSEY